MSTINAWNPFSGQGPPDFDYAAFEKDPEIHNNPFYRQDFGGVKITEDVINKRRKLRVVATGAGAAGLQVAYKFRKLLQDIDLVIYEKNDDVGGTWLENKYPGCACDIPSHAYQFYWNRNPDWSSFYSPAPEILKYLQDTAEKFDLSKYISFRHRVLDTKWDEDKGKWICQIQRPDGTAFIDEADILLATNGGLNKWRFPDVPGRDLFKGAMMHTAAWNTEVDLRDKVVAVIGSGSSAIQVVPGIQPDVKKLLNFVRSPVWLTPGFSAKNAGPEGSNFKYTEEQKEKFRNDPKAHEDYIRKIEEDLGSRFPMQHETSDISKEAKISMKAYMRAKIGNDDIADYLTPEFGLGCRRLSPGNEYMEAFTKGNVQLVKSSVTGFTKNGLLDDQGNEHKADVIICATGFDTTFTPSFGVTGRDGISLKAFYGNFPRSYLAVMTPHFPNFYQFPGPGFPGSHGPVFAVLEWLTRYVMKTVAKIQKESIKAFCPKPEAAVDYYNYSHAMFRRLVYSQPCASWYKNGKRIGPVTSQYPGTRLHWCELLREPRWEDFDYTYFTGNRFQFFGNGYTQEDLDQVNLTWYFDVPEI
ncbi:hypothetical protein H9L39_19227 [Fusarium oxysporum f. sp. albedinis]|nr:hypothetical protein H9L39_19227 [Fusarium oxysporum f. sp. albedinis]